MSELAYVHALQAVAAANDRIKVNVIEPVFVTAGFCD